MTDERDRLPDVNLGYPLAQLLKASTPERAAGWRQVIAGIVSGALRIGTRTPVEVPPWVTLQVLHGGFAIGNLAAGGALQPHEQELLATLPHADGNQRGLLNRHALREGGAALVEMAASGRFRVHVPEEGALLVAAWLVQRGEVARAERLVAELQPFFHQLRFYPVPAARALRGGPGVSVSTVGEAAQKLRAKRAQASVAAMNESLTVWMPLYDRAVALFLETVEDGWPCRTYSSDWSARARALLDDYREARARHQLVGKPEKRRESFARLRGYLATCASDPRALTGRDVGMVRRILAAYVAKHGEPGSERWTALRARQSRDAALPLHHEIARDVAARLDAFPHDEGTPEVVDLIAGLPAGVARKTMRCWEASIEQLIERRVLSSSEAMACVMPHATARVRSAAIDDESLRRVYEAVYLAFRRRRSLLLLDLSSQVKLDELPWIAAVEPWAGGDATTRRASREMLARACTIAFGTFPQTITPNKLVRELRALAIGADLALPLVEELAADIFRGAFTAKFLRAAQTAARLLKGSLYERYYGLSFAAVLALDDVTPAGPRAPVSPGLAAMCSELAGARPGDEWSVARNGAILEQAQILTTHNLAVLFTELDLAERLDLPELVRKTFAWMCRRQQMKILGYQARLQMTKNTAYAWRQLIFYASLLATSQLAPLLDWLTEHLASQSASFAQRFAPVVAGLRAAAEGARFDATGVHASSGGRRFLGWTVDDHWLLPEPAGSP